MGTALDTRTHPNLTLSGGNLVATSTGAGGVYTDRAISGLTYWETVLTTLTGAPVLGIASNNWNQSSAPGVGGDSVGWTATTGVVRNNNATLTTIQTAAGGDRVCFAYHALFRLLWIRTNSGNWNNSGTADPATLVGGIDVSSISVLGTLRPCIFASASGTVFTNTFSSPFTNAVPSGYSSIDVIAYTLAQWTQDPRDYAFPLWTPSSFGFRAMQLPGQSFGKWFMGLTITVVSGTVMELGVTVPGKRVDVYDRDTGELLGTALSDSLGQWSIPCLGRPSVRVVADDPTTYNSLVYDNVVPY